MIRKLLWVILHPFYENGYTKKWTALIVNLFKPDYVIVDGHKVFVDKDDRVVSAELILSGKWEGFESKLFEQNINSGDIVVDIGAHIGLYTLLAARKVGPQGKVYAFEPLQKNFKLLKKNVDANNYQNVILINKAVSDKDGLAKLFLSKENNFGDQRIYNPEGNRRSINISMVRLDSFFKNKKTNVNVIKMDIQGSETKAITGALKTINKNKHVKLFTEFWPKGLFQCGSSGLIHLTLLKKCGFKLYQIDNENNKVSPVSVNKILSDYPQESIFNADLLCLK